MRFVWTGTRAHARMDTRGGDTVYTGDEPWAALMIPHGGGNTQRDNGFISHTHGEYRETYQRGETDNVGMHAVRTALVLRLAGYFSGETRHSHEGEREESQVLFTLPAECQCPTRQRFSSCLSPARGGGKEGAELSSRTQVSTFSGHRQTFCSKSTLTDTRSVLVQAHAMLRRQLWHQMASPSDRGMLTKQTWMSERHAK